MKENRYFHNQNFSTIFPVLERKKKKEEKREREREKQKCKQAKKQWINEKKKRKIKEKTKENKKSVNMSDLASHAKSSTISRVLTISLFRIVKQRVTFSLDQDSRPVGCARNVSVSLMNNLLDNYLPLKANSCTGTTN